MGCPILTGPAILLALCLENFWGFLKHRENVLCNLKNSVVSGRRPGTASSGLTEGQAGFTSSAAGGRWWWSVGGSKANKARRAQDRKPSGWQTKWSVGGSCQVGREGRAQDGWGFALHGLEVALKMMFKWCWTKPETCNKWMLLNQKGRDQVEIGEWEELKCPCSGKFWRAVKHLNFDHTTTGVLHDL